MMGVSLSQRYASAAKNMRCNLLAKADRQAQRQAESRRTRRMKNLAREGQSRFA